MRELKFRALRQFNGTIGSGNRWIYSSLLRIDYERKMLNLGGETCQFETIGQFTGLHDKNGKEIYEGDIISGFIVTYAGDDKECLGMHAGWYLQQDDFERWDELDSRSNVNGNNYEVIGNIHENPELINA